MSEIPKCPECESEYGYDDGSLYICPDCSHEWSKNAADTNQETIEDENVVKDVNGNVLQNGDSIIIIKKLKVKGSGSDLKSGTKVKNIRLVDGDHNIDCKIDGIGAMSLKSEFVKKV